MVPNQKLQFSFTYKTEFQFKPSPTYSRFTIAGESFDLMDGIFGMALTPQWGPDNTRYLSFHSLASIEENAVSLSIINDAKIWETNPNAQPAAFNKIGQRGIQTPGKVINID